MIEIDQKLMESFLRQSTVALFREIACLKTPWDLPAFTACAKQGICQPIDSSFRRLNIAPEESP